MNRIPDILRMLPPPANPASWIDAAVWATVEQQIGILPPPDYREFCSHYGSGFLGTKDDPTWLVLRAPLFEDYGDPDGPFQFRIKHLAGMKKESPNFCPYPILPESGGLFPFAHDDCGFEYYWLTKGSPDTWPVIVLPDLDFEDSDMTFTEFIWSLLNGIPPIPSLKESSDDVQPGPYIWTAAK